jgi:hypothetical protein
MNTSFKMALAFGGLLFVTSLSLDACRSTRSSKSKVKTDSTSVTHTAIDSTVKKDSVHLSKSDMSIFVKKDTSKVKGTTVIEERKKIVEFNDSGKVKKIIYSKKKTTHQEEKAQRHHDRLFTGRQPGFSGPHRTDYL